MKRKAVSLLAMALCASMAVPVMAEIKFSDANDVPWETAKVYISQAAELGLMVGPGELRRYIFIQSKR